MSSPPSENWTDYEEQKSNLHTQPGCLEGQIMETQRQVPPNLIEETLKVRVALEIYNN